MPHKLVLSILQIAGAVWKQPAITVSGKDKEAYDAHLISQAANGLTHPKVSPLIANDLTACMAEDDPHIRQVNVISMANLGYFRDNTRKTVEAAIEKYGEKFVEQVINLSKGFCQTKNLELTHQVSYTDESAIRVNSKTDNILKTKALTAEKFRPEGEDKLETVIYCAPQVKRKTTDKDRDHFIIDLSPGLLKRSCMNITAYSIYAISEQMPTLMVGGNHAQAAWTLSTINTVFHEIEKDDLHLKPEAEQTAALKKAIVKCGIGVLGDFRIPREVSLVGQRYIVNGEATVIEPFRAEKKASPAKKNLKPEDGNKDLERKPMVRAKTPAEQ